MLQKLKWQAVALLSMLVLVVGAGVLSLGSTQVVEHSETGRRVETRVASPTQTPPLTSATPITRFAAIDPALVEAQYEGRLLPDGTVLVVAWSPPVGMYIPQEGLRRLTAPTPTPTFTATHTATVTPSSTATIIPSLTATSTLTSTLTPSASPTASNTPLPPTVTLVFLSSTPTPSISPTPLTPTLTFTPTETHTPTPTLTNTLTSTPTSTFTLTPSNTATNTSSPTPTIDITKVAEELLPTANAYEEANAFIGCAPQGFPVAGVLTQLFKANHRGIDLGVYVGTAVDATHSGTVTYAGWSDLGYGYLVVVESGAYMTIYAHLSDIVVEVGQRVSKGEMVALSGNTGNSSGPHVHYEVRVNEIEVDPFVFETSGFITC